MYYLFFNKKQYGPYTEIQVRAMVTAGKIPANVQVYVQGGMHQWQSLQNFTELLKPANQKEMKLATDPSLFSAPIKNGHEIEKTIWVGRPSSLTVIFKYFGKIILLMILSIIYVFYRIQIDYSIIMYTDFMLLVLNIILLLKITWDFIVLKCIKWTFTSERFNISSGVFSKKISNMELYRVKDMQLCKPFFYRLFGYGYIDLITSDKLNPILCNIGAIKQPEDVLQLLRKYVERQKKIGPIKGIDII